METNKIIEDYNNQMYSKDIRIKYGISWKVLTKILKEAGIYRKCNATSLPESKLEYIRQNYHKQSNLEIANTLNISVDWLTQVAKKLNLIVKGSGWKRNEHLENFDYSCKEFLYYLGWMAADGCISKNFHNVVLKITDEEIVNKFQLLFPFAHIYNYKGRCPNCKPQYSLHICSKELGLVLNDLGITPHKSHTISVPEQIWSTDFLRGYFEGDGHVRKPNKKGEVKWEIGFVSSSEIFTKQLVIYLTKIGMLPKVFPENNYFRIRCSGKENVKIFYDEIYTDCEDRFLSRKKQILDQLFSNE